MRQFTDPNGNAWTIDLDIGTVARIRSVTEKRIDLLAPASKVDGVDLYDVLISDLVEFWGVLWHVVEPQASGRGVNAEQFGKLLAGPVLIAAQQAFFAEWSDFFRRIQRGDMAAPLEVITAAHAKMLSVVSSQSARLPMAETISRMEATIETQLGTSFMSLADSLASTPSG